MAGFQPSTNGRFWVSTEGNRKLGHIRLIPTFEDGFYGGGWYFTFRRDAGGEVAGFTMSTSRAWRVAFRMLRQESARE